MLQCFSLVCFNDSRRDASTFLVAMSYGLSQAMSDGLSLGHLLSAIAKANRCVMRYFGHACVPSMP